MAFPPSPRVALQKVLEAYKNQAGVELAFRWAKGPLRVALIFPSQPLVPEAG